MKVGKRFGLFVLAILLLPATLLVVKWVHYRLTHAITNAVFIESDTFTKVAYKRVAGRIEELFKEEGEFVKKGEALAKIDDRDYRIRLGELKNRIESLRKERDSLRIELLTVRKELENGIKGLSAEIRALEEEVKAISAKADQLRKDRNRFEKLLEKGVIPLRKLEEVDTHLEALEHKRKALEAKIETAVYRRKTLIAKLEGLRSLSEKIEALSNRIRALEKRKADLENLISETVLRSPIDGYVAKRFVSEGEVVRAGQFVYAVYDPRDVYVLVLLEETKLEGVREGSRVKIEIDAFPGEEFEGVVETISRATASKFALIPRDITAGEFTKVAQRIPLKVRITKGRVELLRVGMGGEVAIEKE